MWRALEILASGLAEGDGVDFFMLDFKEAFWQVPLNTAGRRFFCASLLLKEVWQYATYLGIAQGSRGAPNTWARVAALLMWLTQSLFTDKVALMCYVDDPLAVIKGTTEQRRQVAATIVHVWSALGIALSLDKEQFGSEVVWVGRVFKVDSLEVTASIKLSLIEDINPVLEELVA